MHIILIKISASIEDRTFHVRLLLSFSNKIAAILKFYQIFLLGKGLKQVNFGKFRSHTRIHPSWCQALLISRTALYLVLFIHIQNWVVDLKTPKCKLAPQRWWIGVQTKQAKSLKSLKKDLETFPSLRTCSWMETFATLLQRRNWSFIYYSVLLTLITLGTLC